MDIAAVLGLGDHQLGERIAKAVPLDDAPSAHAFQPVIEREFQSLDADAVKIDQPEKGVEGRARWIDTLELAYRSHARQRKRLDLLQRCRVGLAPEVHKAPIRCRCRLDLCQGHTECLRKPRVFVTGDHLTGAQVDGAGREALCERMAVAIKNPPARRRNIELPPDA